MSVRLFDTQSKKTLELDSAVFRRVEHNEVAYSCGLLATENNELADVKTAVSSCMHSTFPAHAESRRILETTQ